MWRNADIFVTGERSVAEDLVGHYEGVVSTEESYLLGSTPSYVDPAVLADRSNLRRNSVEVISQSIVNGSDELLL
jgi:hypothetical protein